MAVESVGTKIATSTMAILAGIGITPDHAPVAFAIFVGLMAGTLAAFPKERHLRLKEHVTWWQWLMGRLFLWGALTFVVLSLQEIAEGFGYSIEARLAGGLAMLCAYMGPEILLTLSSRAKRELENRNRPDGT